MAMPQRDDSPSRCALRRAGKMEANVDDLAQLHQKADAGDADALYRLGMRYSRGEGAVRDAVIGSRLLYLASQKGHAEAGRSLDAWWGD